MVRNREKGILRRPIWVSRQPEGSFIIRNIENRVLTTLGDSIYVVSSFLIYITTVDQSGIKQVAEKLIHRHRKVFLWSRSCSVMIKKYKEYAACGLLLIENSGLHNNTRNTVWVSRNKSGKRSGVEQATSHTNVRRRAPILKVAMSLSGDMSGHTNRSTTIGNT